MHSIALLSILKSMHERFISPEVKKFPLGYLGFNGVWGSVFSARSSITYKSWWREILIWGSGRLKRSLLILPVRCKTSSFSCLFFREKYVVFVDLLQRFVMCRVCEPSGGLSYFLGFSTILASCDVPRLLSRTSASTTRWSTWPDFHDCVLSFSFSLIIFCVSGNQSLWNISSWLSSPSPFELWLWLQYSFSSVTKSLLTQHFLKRWSIRCQDLSCWRKLGLRLCQNFVWCVSLHLIK